MCRIVFIHRGEFLLRLDKPCVLPTESDGTHAAQIEQPNDLRVQLAVEHHLGDLHRLFIRHAKPRDKRGFLSNLLEEPCDLGSSSMHENRTDPDEFHQCHVAHDIFLERVIDHRVPAVLDNDGCPVKFLDVRERVYENLRLVLIGIHRIPPSGVILTVDLHIFIGEITGPDLCLGIPIVQIDLDNNIMRRHHRTQRIRIV